MKVQQRLTGRAMMTLAADARIIGLKQKKSFVAVDLTGTSRLRRFHDIRLTVNVLYTTIETDYAISQCDVHFLFLSEISLLFLFGFQ